MTFVVGVGDEAQRERETGEHQRPRVQIGDRASAREADAGHAMVEVLAVGCVYGAAVLQALEHHECRVEERHREQDQGQHERHDGGGLDGSLDRHDSHEQTEQVGAAVAHEARCGRKVVHKEAERRAGCQRREHAGFGALEIERDDGERAGDDHAHARRQAVHAVGEVDDVHHHHEPHYGERRPGVGGARFGEGERADERQRDRLHDDAEVHHDHGRRDLTGELHDRRQLEAIVERPHDGYEGCGEQHAVPKLGALVVARRQERQHGHEHAREDRKAAEQRCVTAGESTLARFVHGADRACQPHRERREQRSHGRGCEECVKRVELVEMRHRLAHSIAGAGVVRRPSQIAGGGWRRQTAYAAAGAFRCSYSG
jgi:hypothetical protein